MSSVIGVLRSLAKSLLSCVAPRTALVLSSMRARHQTERRAASNGLADLSRRLSAVTQGRVACGPFAGTRLDYEALPTHGAPKLLGTYESELWPFLEDQLTRRPETIVNIGAAEGYYAVGLARLLHEASVHAYEADPKARRAIIRNAEINGVSKRVRAHGLIDHATLERVLASGKSLAIMDCEGAERQLLDFERVPNLTRTDLLVELHPEVDPEIAKTLSARCAPSHDIRIVEPAAAPSKLEFVPDTIALDLAEACVDERRGDNSWLYAVTRSSQV